MLTVISLGAGVQSSTVLLMAEKGIIGPRPDFCIFADTQAEPKKVYAWLDWLEKQTSIPILRVTKEKGLRSNIVEALKGGRFASAPFYTEGEAGKREGMLRRQCTREFKVEPITKEVRRLLGLPKGKRAKKGKQVQQWIGISTDEASRMKPSQQHYIEHRWPLIEMSMSRQDCLDWMRANGYEKPGKSACTFCPYHDDAMWLEMKEEDPESFADAVEIDEMIRGGVRGTTQKLYLHESLQPLAEIDFRKMIADQEARAAARALERSRQGILSLESKPDKFDEACEGLCGL